jgi:superfamily I DNA/RNA helicase
MPLDIQRIDRFTHNHENRMWDQLVGDLEESFKDDGHIHILLGNFRCGRQFDAFYVGPRAACIVDFKAYSGMLHAPENGTWYIDEAEVKASGGINPLIQIQNCKFDLANRIPPKWHSILRETQGPNWLFTSGRVAFDSPLEWDGHFDHRTSRWFDVTEVGSLAGELLEMKVKTFALTNDQLKLVKQAVLGIEERKLVRSTANKARWLYFKESDFNRGLRELRLKQGEPQIAANIFESFPAKIRSGRDPFADVRYDKRPEIEGLRSYHITPNHRLLLIHYHGKNYLLMIGTADAAEVWIESNRGFIFTVDPATGEIAATQKQIETLDVPTSITLENTPFIERVVDAVREAEIPAEALLPVQELDENSSMRDRSDAIKAVDDPVLREVLGDVVELTRTGKVDQAIARLKLFGDRVMPLSEAPELQEIAVSSGENSEQLVDLAELEPAEFEKFLNSLEDETWMHFLHPQQKRVVDENHEKATILTGVSGSGKTSVLMHRARRLAAENPGEKVLVLTLNKNLAKLISIGMDNFCEDEVRNRIEVVSFHDFLADFLASTDVRGFLENFAEYTGQQEAMTKLLAGKPLEDLPRLFQPLEEAALRNLFHEFLGQMEGEDRESLRNLEVFLDAQSPGIDAENYIYEELELIRSAFPCFNEYGDYLTDFERQGRGIGLQKTRKEQILRILKLWERHQIDFHFFDHMGLTQAAFLAFEENGCIPDAFRRRFVLVDEFQDLSDLELRILLGVPRAGRNSLFLTGDFAQKLYAKQLDLGAVGLGRDSRVMRSIRKNYRNSRQILRAADRLLTCWPGATANDADIEVLRPEFATRETSKPAAYRAEDPVLAAWRDVAEAISEHRLPSQAVCVISANTLKYPVEEILEASPEGLATRALTEWSSDDELRSVPVADITSVKGFEFKVVFILGLEQGSFPASGRHAEEVWRDAQRLYVAITRGMNEVRMYHRGKPSVMLEAMEDAIDFFEAPPLPLASAVVSASASEAKETDVTVPWTEDVNDVEPVADREISEDGECWTQTIINGIRYLVFERCPDQLELAAAACCLPAHIQLLLFHEHNLALVPINRLEKHLVEKLCRSMGFVAEFRSAPVVVTAPEPELPHEVVDVTEDLPIEEEEPERETIVTVPLEGIPVGPLTLGTLEREFKDYRPPFGQTDLVEAAIREYAVVGPDDLRLFIHDVRLEGHERYVTCGRNDTDDKVWNRLVDRLRLGVKTLGKGDLLMELRQARFTTGKWSNRFRATRDQLKTGAGLDVPNLLYALGALRTGTKEEVYNETNRNRRQYCVTFAEGNTAVPLAAYAAVTILPLLNDYRQEATQEED